MPAMLNEFQNIYLLIIYRKTEANKRRWTFPKHLIYHARSRNSALINIPRSQKKHKNLQFFSSPQNFRNPPKKLNFYETGITKKDEK
jgi:hypothetical protein